ncbi:MAG: DUF1211 domain-containing protein [Candidatus Nomurabacteria bacterium]|nr:MAG: DUF1211 domain-containing protein [Candidatus Nomurabacteria bacterium]
MSMSLSAEEQTRIGVDRFVFFSDAVFAIAITLLALEIHLPENVDLSSESSVLSGLIAIIPSFFSYVLSFLVIGAIWSVHVRKYRALVQYDRVFMMSNLVLLLFVAFIPFPTALLSESDTKVATILYASTFVVIELISFVSWQYAVKKKFLSANIAEQTIRNGLFSSLAMGAIFLISIVIALFNADIAKFSWLLIIPALRFIR